MAITATEMVMVRVEVTATNGTQLYKHTRQSQFSGMITGKAGTLLSIIFNLVTSTLTKQ